MWLAMPRPTAVNVPVTRLQMSVAPADEIGGCGRATDAHGIALSPDGRTMMFSGVQKNQRAL